MRSPWRTGFVDFSATWCDGAGMGLCAGFRFVRAETQEAGDGRGIVRAGRGHHDCVCLVWVGVWRNYEENDSFAIDPEDFDGADRMAVISVESYRSPVCYQFLGCVCPFGQVVGQAANRPEPN